MQKIMCYLLTLLVAASILSGCGTTANESNEQNESTLSESEAGKLILDFYDADYEYEKTISTRDDAGAYKTVLTGKIVQSPYTEYIKVESTTGSSWDEAYYYTEGGTLKSKLHTNEGWQSTANAGTREYPYGYREKLEVSELSDPEDGVAMFTASYTTDISGNYGISTELPAVITQTYYVDTEANHITQIDTDLTEYTRMRWIANYMSANGKDYEQAVSAADAVGKFTSSEILMISHYNDDITITVP